MRNIQQSAPNEILDHFGLRHTQCRQDVLSAFLTSPHALSHHDIETGCASKHDRVTVYRTLKTFVDKGIIHKIPDEGGEPKYGLCSEQCDEQHHHDNHLHFKCETCGKTICLSDTQIPEFDVPDEYEQKEVQVLVLGICGNCSQTR